jgi:hypothetical protein
MSAEAPSILAIGASQTLTAAVVAKASLPFGATVLSGNASVATAPAGSACAGTITKASGAVVGTFSIAAAATSAAVTVNTKIEKVVTNKALTSDVATLTTSAVHGYLVGDTVTVSNVDSTFNGTYVITVVGSTTTFSYAKVAANVTSVADTGDSVVSGRNELAANEVLTVTLSSVGSGTAATNLNLSLAVNQSARASGANVHSNTVHRGNHPGSVLS